MEEIQIFNNNLYKTTYNFDWKTLHPIFLKMVNDANHDGLEAGDTLTSYKNELTPNMLPELVDYYNFITPVFKDVLINKWGYPSENEYEISGTWVMRYGEGGYIKEHDHSGVIGVICAYLNIPNNSANTIFKDPYYHTKVNISTKGDDWLWKSIECVTNDVLIFHGGCVHKTNPNKSKEERWVLSSNIKTKKNISKLI
jgi:hypothetical protein